jgi:hypothetical protein
MRRFPQRAAATCWVTLLILLVGCGTSHATLKLAGTPTATVDVAMQAYVGVLRQFYAPYSVDAQQEVRTCGDPVHSKSTKQLPTIFPYCRPLEVNLMATAQGVLDHLGSVAPPARWQTADGELKQALKASMAFSSALVQAMDAQSTSQYVAVESQQGPPTATLFCDPIAQFNAGPPPLTPQLLVPVADLCATSD